jgi:hypothetical protein
MILIQFHSSPILATNFIKTNFSVPSQYSKLQFQQEYSAHRNLLEFGMLTTLGDLHDVPPYIVL